MNPAPAAGIHLGLGGRFAEECAVPFPIETEDESFQALQLAGIAARAAIGPGRSAVSGPCVGFHDPSASKEKQ